MHFCALRFLHFKVLATLASGCDWQRLTPIIWDGVCPYLSSLAIDRVLFLAFAI
jgi:hypothetical protein